jgi:hypothetical protein
VVPEKRIKISIERKMIVRTPHARRLGVRERGEGLPGV